MCYCCGKKGHNSPQCPQKDTRKKDQWAIRKAEQHLQTETISDDDESIGSNKTNGTNRSSQRAGWSGLQVNLMNHDHEPSIRETITWDNGSTLSLFCNPELVEYIRESKTILKMHNNAGSKLSNQLATVPEFGTVLVQKDATANSFGFGGLVDQYQMTYDSAKDDAFLVLMKDKTVKFTWNSEGLYHFNVRNTYKIYLRKKKEREKWRPVLWLRQWMRTRLYIPGESKISKEVISYCGITNRGSIQGNAKG